MSSRTLVHLADQVLNRPLLLAPEKLSVIMAALDGRLGIDVSAVSAIPEASRFVGSRTDRSTGAALAFGRTDDGVAIIHLVGSFVNRGAYVGASSGLISYEGVQHQLRAAGADPKVRAVVLDLESPGGQALGAFETARAVRDLAAIKPVVAIINGMAASAAYAIASAATRIVTTESGISGSIGVVLLHVDRQGAMEKAGLRPTLIHAGAHKVDGNPYEALPKAVRDTMQVEVDALMGMFVGCVASGRKSLTEAAIRSTEARTFMGVEAVKAGLADDVGTFETVLAELGRGAPRPARRAPQPSPSAKIRTGNMDEELAIRADERSRIMAITGAPEAKGRETQAMALALSTGLGVEEAIAVMAASPKGSTTAADAAASFGARMDARKDLNLDPEASSVQTDPNAIDWSAIGASLNASRGFTKVGA